MPSHGFAAKSSAKSTIHLKTLGQQMQSAISTQDEMGLIEMKIIEKNGDSKIRSMSYSRLHLGTYHYSLMRMRSPKDIQGTALLSVIHNGKEEKWIYLPSSKQTRKITTSEGNARILDSELYTEDFDLGVIQSSKARILKSSSDAGILVEASPQKSKSVYGKTHSWIKNNLIQKAELFDKKNHLFKVVQFSNYQKIGSSSKWRPLKISIENLQNHRKTELIFSKIKVNQKLQAQDFTVKALANDF